MQQPAAAATEKWIDVLQRCRNSKDPQQANRLLAHMRAHRLDSHPLLCNYLVPALADCWSLPEALLLFDSLPAHHRDLRSWNSLISACVDRGHARHALLLYHQMQQQPYVQPTRITFLALLGACSVLADPEAGRFLHAQLVRLGMEADVHVGSPLVGNTLVNMYSKCHSFADALHVFHSLPLRDAVSWNALIAAFTEHGSGEEAGKCFNQMQLEGISPGTVTFVSSLKACGTTRALGKGQEFHMEAVKRGLERELHLGSSLIDMYSQCGSFADARHVFCSFGVRDVVLWNAVITAYTECRLADEAKDCLQQMHAEGISPDSVTLVCTLIACCTLTAIETGRETHAVAVERGYEGDLRVGNALVDMYGKCGLLMEACKVYCQIPCRDVGSWAALIAGYAEHGHFEEASNLFQQMLKEEVPPLPLTFICILKACGTNKELEKGRKLHAEATKRGLETALHVGSTLVDMYNECGPVADARKVFDSLLIRDVVTWNALITGLTEHGRSDEARKCFFQMLLDGTPPNSVTLACSLKACRNTRTLETGWDLHIEAIKRGWERELDVGTLLVDMYGKCGSLAEAREVFDRLHARDIESWGALITGYAEHGFSQEAVKCFQKMHQEGLAADPTTLLCSLKACGTVGALRTGRELHIEVTKRGLERELYMGSILVDMYGECGSCAEAHQVFDKLSARSVVAWTAMIKAFGKNHEGDMAVKFFSNMLQQGVRPSPVTFICLLAACSHSSLVFKGQEYFKLMSEHEVNPTLDHYACMVDIFARSGYVYEAERFVAAMQCPPSGIILYALLSSSKVYGKVELGERCFQQLVELNQEDSSAYLLMAEIYASSGRWKDAIKLEELRKSAGAIKKPGSVSIEMSNQVHEFVVGVNPKEEVSKLLECLSAHIRDEGYVPVVGLISINTLDKEMEA